MSWTNPEKALANIARRELGWQDPQYRLVLQNVAGIRPRHGKVSSTDPAADQAGFERYMAFCESMGFVDSKNGQGYWTNQAAKQRQRIHYKIQELYERARRHHLFDTEDALAGFIERQTANRPPERGGPTRSLEDLDAVESFKVLEGLKKWTWNLARQRGVNMNA